MARNKKLYMVLIALCFVALLAGYLKWSPPGVIASVKASSTFAVPEKLTGVGYGPSRDGEDPTDGVLPTEQALQEDLRFISEFANSIRTYGTTGSLEKIPQFCQGLELDCYPGAWISSDDKQNEREIESLIQIGNQGLSSVRGLMVGNEALLRQDVSENKLISYIKQVKKSTSLPVGTAEPWNVWMEHPELAQTVDLIFVHIYPYWDGISVDQAAAYVFGKWQGLKEAFPGKKVIIGETGWPTEGNRNGESVPSEANQEQFLSQFLILNRTYNVEYFFFEAFDEKWKETLEGSVGSHWGLYYSKGSIKPLLSDLIPQEAHQWTKRDGRESAPPS